MRLIVDTDARTLTEETNGEVRHLDLYSNEAFERLSHHWLRVGWNQKYPYTFSWMGRPIIQIPEDMIRAQEVIFRIQPDVIIETGIAHGGSLIFYASLCKIMGKGRVIGIDIEIRPHNRRAIEEHWLYPLITLVEGSSTEQKTVSSVRDQIHQDESVMIFLDSNHSRKHVLDELKTYGDLVTQGSYIIATDGLMKDLDDVPRGNAEWKWDNPVAAVKEFLKETDEFVLENPAWLFNESSLSENVTHWPSAWLKKKA